MVSEDRTAEAQKALAGYPELELPLRGQAGSIRNCDTTASLTVGYSMGSNVVGSSVGLPVDGWKDEEIEPSNTPTATATATANPTSKPIDTPKIIFRCLLQHESRT